ncbi:MAG: hypothetical protein MK101_03470 [Phycisphaerales bacterium]|nr:hypothetical protein [Phycisphaerales bacterium]
MDERTFYRQLGSLLDALEQLPEAARAALARRMGVDGDSPERINHALGQTTDALRLAVAYQAFDLEATRRENRYLRRIIEEQARARSEDDED